MKYLVCYSGGHSSALVAIEAVRKYGKNNVILLNHDISSEVEHEDIKRFKNEIAKYLGIEITYANMDNFERMTPLKICKSKNGFQFQVGQALCTFNLKTKPFYEWLDRNYPASFDEPNNDIVILYGFDKNEAARINRRVGVLGSKGYKTDYPLALWERSIYDTEEIGIKKPITYEIFKHANCLGCIKAGRQHWYVVYCLYPHIFNEANELEKEIGYSIIKGIFLEELLPKFELMKYKGIVPVDNANPNTFWANVRKELGKDDEDKPCECAL